MMRTLQSPWVAAVAGILAYLLTTAWLLRPGKMAGWVRPPVAARAGVKIEPLVPSWAFKNPEMDQLLAQLLAEREAVRAKEKELGDLATRLNLERQEIGTITQRVASLQAEMDRTFVRIKEDEMANLKRLAKVYATMAPESAAKIFLEFQDEAAVKIFAFMKESETAPILENMAKEGPGVPPGAARRVAVISDRLRLLNANRAAAAPDRTPTPP